MTHIIFEAHATSFDNESGLSSGHNDVDLSPLGFKQAYELGERYKGTAIDAVYCSDLQRAYKTAAIAFAGRFVPIFIDARLRECDYGDLTQSDAEIVKSQRAQRVSTAFPNGESYTQTCARMLSFLHDIAARHQPAQTVMIIGHRATQYGLEHGLNGMSITESVTAPWKWQPGWAYTLDSLQV